MKSYFFLLVLAVLASGCARPQYFMEVTDLNGSKKQYFANDEAIMFDIQWLNGDAGKSIKCSIINTYNGEVAWRGVALLPETKPHQKIAIIPWNPPFPSGGVKLKRGNYTASCNFNDEDSISKSVSVTNVKPWPQ